MTVLFPSKDSAENITTQMITFISTDSGYNRESFKLIERDIEPLLQPETRKSLYPIKFPALWNFYKIHRSLHWDESDVDLSRDIDDLATLTSGEKYFLNMVLSFFANSDFLVNESVDEDMKDVSIHEYKFFMADKEARENVHSITYANFLQFYVKDEQERTMFENAVLTIPTIKKKAEWFRKYIQDGSFAERVVATVITEGIYFSASFASVFYFKKRGKLPSLCAANALISRDENLHALFSMDIYNMLVNKLPEDYVIEMIKEAVEIEFNYINHILPEKLIGMNSELMNTYIRFVADYVCNKLIGKKIYNVENPFDFMNMISIGTTDSDFFSYRPVEYSKHAGLLDDRQNQITFDEEF